MIALWGHRKNDEVLPVLTAHRLVIDGALWAIWELEHDGTITSRHYDSNGSGRLIATHTVEADDYRHPDRLSLLGRPVAA